ncbi:MAG: hypothetical protein FWD75_00815 [Propionibacteriaceae bacterium]|nr:hypothetical protein [Propionibacteriaceae bacterium]
MIIRTEDILETAADKAKTVAEQGAAAWDEAVERITPLLDAAAKKVAPVADDAWEAAKDATRRAAGIAADKVERMQPSVNSALEKVTPAVDRAQKAVQEDLLPKLIEVLHEVAATPAGAGAREILAHLDERADASISALTTELVKSKKSSKAKTIATVAAVGAVVGALAIAIRTFLGSREDWAAYEPDEPYVYPDDDYEIDEVLVDIDTVAPAHTPAEDAATADSGVEADAGAQPYGEGSYAGPTPPEGFVIKGNERSMKYHLPDAAGYSRTGGDVWFSSEEAAQAAGFVRSQR